MGAQPGTYAHQLETTSENPFDPGNPRRPTTNRRAPPPPRYHRGGTTARCVQRTDWRGHLRILPEDFSVRCSWTRQLELGALVCLRCIPADCCRRSAMEVILTWQSRRGGWRRRVDRTRRFWSLIGKQCCGPHKMSRTRCHRLAKPRLMSQNCKDRLNPSSAHETYPNKRIVRAQLHSPISRCRPPTVDCTGPTRLKQSRRCARGSPRLSILRRRVDATQLNGYSCKLDSLKGSGNYKHSDFGLIRSRPVSSRRLSDLRDDLPELWTR